mmetsp:Transcript_48979/g.76405  ORF Transcript_48979/g.76405 Transcript_48979/m.76405 type:complete len:126 (+) Transcript_48979:120-497(+)
MIASASPSGGFGEEPEDILEMKNHETEPGHSQSAKASAARPPIDQDQGNTWLPSPQREASGALRSLGSGSRVSDGPPAHRSRQTRQPPDIIGHATESDDVSQLGEFLLALRNEDSDTSSGRGLPF